MGGRVAGCLSALGIAGRGGSVVVLEARHFPSDTISTHFFRGDGLVRALAEQDLLEEVLATGAPRLTREYFFLEGATAPQVGPPQEPGEAGFCLSVRRCVLDAILVARAAATPGVTVLTGRKVVEVLTSGAIVVGVRDASGAEHRAAVVVGADGRRSGVARRVGAADQDRRPAARAMYYRYVAGWTAPGGGPPDGPEFSLVGNELAYVFPADAGLACVALSVSIDAYATARQDAPGYLAARLPEHVGLWPRLRATAPVGGLFVGPPRDSVIREAAGRGWALVGDAGTHQDPWSGFGMDTAARQAEVLGECVASGSPTWAADYAAARDRVTLERFATTVTHAPDLRALVG